MKGYLVVVTVGSTPAVIALPVVAAVNHLENLEPVKKPEPFGAVKVPAAALFPKVNLFVPKLILAPVMFKLYPILTLFTSQLIFGVAILVLVKSKFLITLVLNVPDPDTV